MSLSALKNTHEIGFEARGAFIDVSKVFDRMWYLCYSNCSNISC